MRIEPGKCWTFVNGAGERTAYVVEATEPPDTRGARVRLRNLGTGKIACVTWEWMLRETDKGARWEYNEGAEAVLPKPPEDKPEPLVIFHMGAGAIIGPAGAWESGDRVTIPARGPKHGDDGLPEFDGVVNGIAIDGLARVAVWEEQDIAA
jgi:hypothetical protein